ncbi:class I tRNA ligase family protein, partial [Patescibacteria group bacterium]|nr:class I tRNA ligase family protein [Patescibacteria group bacterium]
MRELEKTYNPGAVEDEIYKKWEKSGYFNPDNLLRQGKPFSIIMPPPNVTGTLHLGHAVMLAIEDILIRYHRMQGERTLWLPGTDHAAIATQTKVEKLLKEREGKTRYDLGREKFLAEVDKFISETKVVIKNQIRKMGSSCDWSREAYTLDEPRTRAVRTVFKEMHDDGLIYRGERIVNWDPALQTTVSDDEVEWVEKKSPFYYFKYGPFVISTARPETKFGDKYVVMHPDDKRYKKYKHGEKMTVEWINGPINATVIKDKAIDINFGTGVMTITPWHDAIDFEIAERHNLDKEQIIDFDGKLLPIAGEFSGMKIEEAREKIVEKLRAKGLVDHIDENYVHRVAINSRGEGLIEPQIKKQWFVDVNKPVKRRGGKTLKKLMREAVAGGKIKIIPERFSKTYFHWIDNLRDWNISRQIWFGHRIPVWYCENCNEPVVTDLSPTEILFMRHGESRSNFLNQLNSDVSNQTNGLTENGKKAVHEVIEGIKNKNFDAIFCSDFKRTKETAAIINEYFHLPIIEDKRLCEVGVGEFEGGPDMELDNFRKNNLEAWQDGNPKGIESFESFKSRVFEFLEEVTKKYAGKKVLVITHGDVCRMVQGFKKNISDNRDFLKLDYPKPAGTLEIKFAPVSCPTCGLKDLKQDPDTLDTWFSSGLWTFSTLGWPEKTKDLKTYHPTSVLETGYDILFFWIARMILMTTYVLGDIPFHNVYLHGLIRDEKGRKMSKSLGNIIDPLDMIEKYGTDAVRLSLVLGTSPGNDMKLSDEKIAGFRNFTNKLWNIGRYVIEKTKGENGNKKIVAKTLAERWIMSRLNNVIGEVTKHLDKFEFSQAGEKLRAFTWDEFADWYIEINKIQPNNLLLENCYASLLKLWHPFMPFVTETLWPNFGENLLMISKWPKAEKKLADKKAEKDFEVLKNVVTTIRAMRADYKIEPAKRVSLEIYGGTKTKLLEEQAGIIRNLARVENLVIKKFGTKPEWSAGAVVEGMEIYLPLAGLIDVPKEKARLGKELAEAEKYLGVLENKLSNKEFLANAPKELVAGEKEK